MFLKASEAREITNANLQDISTCMLIIILEEVEDTARKGETFVVSSWTNKTLEDVSKVEHKLRELGYNVKLERVDDDYTFSISWEHAVEEKDLKLIATERWCSVSNAIIKKYKFMVEDDKEYTVYINTALLKDELIKSYGFTEKDFEDWE